MTAEPSYAFVQTHAARHMHGNRQPVISAVAYQAPWVQKQYIAVLLSSMLGVTVLLSLPQHHPCKSCRITWPTNFLSAYARQQNFPAGETNVNFGFCVQLTAIVTPSVLGLQLEPCLLQTVSGG